MRARIHGAIFWPAAMLGVVALACLLAGPIHGLLAGLGWLGGSDRDFLRVFRRLLVLPLVAVFLWRVRPWRGVGGDAYGLRGPNARARPFVLGFTLTLAALLGVLAWQLQQGWLRFEDPLRWGELARRLVTYLVGGFVIALFEEWFFRGWCVERVGRRLGPVPGVLVPAAIFALLHAFRPSRLEAPVTHDAAGALEALRGWGAHMIDLAAFGPAALGLFCFALLLTAAHVRTRTLWAPVGIHMAAVLVISSYGALTDRSPPRTWAGSRVLYDGPVIWALALVGAFVLWRGRDSSAPPAPAPGSGP